MALGGRGLPLVLNSSLTVQESRKEARGVGCVAWEEVGQSLDWPCWGLWAPALNPWALFPHQNAV